MKAPATVLAILLGIQVVPVAEGALAPGWQTVDLAATGSYAMVYLPPPAFDGSGALPAVVFLHGAGSRPLPYSWSVGPAAVAAGAVAILPKSLTGLGWGAPGDDETIVAAIELVGSELDLDPERIAIAGHSAGGAFAYLLAYSAPSRFSGVFSMAARFYPIEALAGEGYVAPIRLYYGGLDPNFVAAFDLLVAQWERLGVPWEADVQPGYGHNGWPQESLDEGFRFLARQRRPLEGGDEGGGGGDDGGEGDPGPCVPSPTLLCLRDERFAATVRFSTPDAGAGEGRVAPVASDDSGLFWFFDPANWELLVKVLDGCSINGHYWVFAAATTDVAYELRIDDLEAGETWSHTNPAGTPAPALTETLALASCP